VSTMLGSALLTDSLVTHIVRLRGWLEVNLGELCQFCELAYFYAWRDINIC
jgi:hypothetical protein